MSNCKLQTLYFAATEFEVLDEFEGEKGFFIKSFLINNKLNLNDWEVTKEANRLDGPEFKGMPGIEFFNKGRRDHTVGSTYAEALKLQSPHAKGIIRKVIGTETGEKLTQISRIFDEEMEAKIKKAKKEGKKMFVSPAIFPRSIDDVEIIERPEGGHIHRVHRYLPLHYAFVDEPAYGGDAAITDVCEGADCLIKLAKSAATDGIGQDEVDPLRTMPIIRVSKCSKTGKINVSVTGDDNLSKLVSECLSNKLPPGEEPTDQQLAICFSESREKLKSNTSKIHQSKSYGNKMSNVDITKEEKEKLDARLTALEDTETKRKEEEAKKAKQKKAVETEDNHEEDMLEAVEDDDMTEEEKEEARKKAKKSKKAVDKKETEKEKEQTAKIAALTKIANTPIVEQYLAARKMIGDDEEKLEKTKTAMLKASVEDNQAKLDEIKPFLAQLQFNTEAEQKSATVKFPYGLGGEQFSGSTSSKTAEQMYEELYE